MKESAKTRGMAALLTVPLLALLLMSCGEPIIKEDSSVLQPVITLATTTFTTATVTTTVTVNPLWQENAYGNYNAMGGAVILCVPHFTQFDSYFTACESIAAVSMMQYYGINITLDQFIDSYLPRTDYPSLGTDGELHGESPWDYFIGDPRDAAGFGCYSTAIAKGINKIKDGLAIPLRNLSLSELCEQYIDKGQPVEIWGTINMAQPYTSEFHWITPDGKRYDFINPEHACLLIGYDDMNYYFSDSMSAADITPVEKQLVETAYQGMFRQAVVIDPIVLESLPERMRTAPANAAEALKAEEDLT